MLSGLQALNNEIQSTVAVGVPKNIGSKLNAQPAARPTPNGGSANGHQSHRVVNDSWRSA